MVIAPSLKPCNWNPRVSLEARLPHVTSKEELLVHCWIKRKSRCGLVCEFEPMWTKIIRLTNRVEKLTWETPRVAKLVRMVEEPKNVRVPRPKVSHEVSNHGGNRWTKKRLVQPIPTMVGCNSGFGEGLLVVVSIENMHLDWVITCIRAFWAFESHLSRVAPKMKRSIGAMDS